MRPQSGVCIANCLGDDRDRMDCGCCGCKRQAAGHGMYAISGTDEPTPPNATPYVRCCTPAIAVSTLGLQTAGWHVRSGMLPDWRHFAVISGRHPMCVDPPPLNGCVERPVSARGPYSTPTTAALNSGRLTRAGPRAVPYSRAAGRGLSTPPSMQCVIMHGVLQCPVGQLTGR
jgi:hypothetical protein